MRHDEISSTKGNEDSEGVRGAEKSSEDNEFCYGCPLFGLFFLRDAFLGFFNAGEVEATERRRETVPPEALRLR